MMEYQGEGEGKGFGEALDGITTPVVPTFLCDPQNKEFFISRR